MSETTNGENGNAAGGRMQALVMRLKALGALALMLLLFWLPLWYASRETLGVAWRWMRDDVPHEYGKWASAVACVIKVIITGRDCGA